MDNKITIIEGPTPNFDSVETDFIIGVNGWTAGLNEGPYLFNTARTTLRTFNGEALIERCHKAWAQKVTMFLEYRDPIGLKKEVPIVAARAIDSEKGDMLVLWVRQEPEEDDEEADIDIDFGDMDAEW
jgi:hypothetical protein